MIRPFARELARIILPLGAAVIVGSSILVSPGGSAIILSLIAGMLVLVGIDLWLTRPSDTVGGDL